MKKTFSQLFEAHFKKNVLSHNTLIKKNKYIKNYMYGSIFNKVWTN